jgi:C1A family cysteine protease
MRWAPWFVLAWAVSAFGSSLPSSYDLRNIGGKSYVSAVKSQSGGTCWTHGTMAALEGNLLKTGIWQNAGETGEANLAEYHLDWWNGFNQHHNADIAPQTGGLTVHQGGDYRVAAAFLTRTGAVRDSDAQSYSSAPKEAASTYHQFYVRDIEWMSAGPNLERIDRIKQALYDHGVVGTALTWSSSYFNSSDNTFYQAPTSSSDPNHAVAIVGWDDNKKTKAPKPGAWLIKNSWGSGWGDGGYFWISYYDKIAGQHAEMGAVSFQNVEPMRYDNIYFYDYHGWRDTKKGVSEAFNAFVAKGAATGNEMLTSASFYTAADDVEYSVQVYGGFENGELTDLLSQRDGIADVTGFHTVDLNWPVGLQAGQKFYVLVHLSQGGHPFDKTSNVPLLLGGDSRPTVESRSKPGQSFYRTAQGWVDLTKDDATANFCIKGLTENK